MRQRHGTQFEGKLGTYHQALELRGEAIVAKVPNPVVIRSVDAQGWIRGRLGDATWTDYTGVLKGGRGLALEAKATKQARWSVSGLRPIQLDRLRAVDAMGGLALVLIWSTTYQRLTIVRAAELVSGQGWDLAASGYRDVSWWDYLNGRPDPQGALWP